MTPITATYAAVLVRKNLDEQALNDSQKIDFDDNDSDELDSLICKTLPESINAVHGAAPVAILDGKKLVIPDPDDEDPGCKISIEDDVLDVSIREEVLRVVAFQAADSPYVVTEVIPEESTEGRMQYNPYTRGSWDRPKLVLLQGKAGDEYTRFRYYCLEEFYSNAGDAIKLMEYLPVYRYEDTYSMDTSYDVADAVLQNVIDELTARVLVVYGYNDKAAVFTARASFGQPAQ